jgi:hypothetical protein
VLDTTSLSDSYVGIDEDAEAEIDVIFDSNRASIYVVKRADPYDRIFGGNDA